MLARISLLLSVLVTPACVRTGSLTWSSPSASDRRSPCPMLNALANHGYLARDGRNISMDQLKTALAESVNLDPAATAMVGALALETSTTGYRDTFHLDDLAKHGMLEHDGSLSREDDYLGDNLRFDPAVWAQTRTHFTLPIISIQTAARARAAGFARAAATNPAYSLSADDGRHSLIEQVLYLAVFGSPTAGDANTEHVKIMFEEERIPFAEGFRRSGQVLTVANIMDLASKLSEAS